MSDNKVDCLPTKSFFIETLIRDISLADAILEFVDNSLDGARELRAETSSDKQFNGLEVQLQLKKDKFTIKDNCGGIDIQTAKDYVFRFGRPKARPETKHSVGEFGVGMKRAIFKIGKEFCVQSEKSGEKWEVKVNVPEWSKNDDQTSWSFDINVNPNHSLSASTKVEICQLHEGIGEEFELEVFQSELIYRIRKSHLNAISKGMLICVNGVPVDCDPVRILQSEELIPAYVDKEYPSLKGKILAKLYAGITESNPSEAGWYLFLNGRSVLIADRTERTGWGETSEDGKKLIPKSHHQFARFRGYAFLDSDDQGTLPWNTAKTGVDSDSPVFKKLRKDMIILMRPIIDFLNELDNEKDVDSCELDEIVNRANLVELPEVTPQTSFKYELNVPTNTPKQKMARISYQKPREEVEAVKQVLGVTANRDVGIRTFDYYKEYEVE